jgi:glyceraldehyde 3-phosphate dehydrogenase
VRGDVPLRCRDCATAAAAGGGIAALSCCCCCCQVIHEQLGIAHGCITTIHNLTNTQTVIDAPNTKKTDLRRAR